MAMIIVQREYLGKIIQTYWNIKTIYSRKGLSKLSDSFKSRTSSIALILTGAGLGFFNAAQKVIWRERAQKRGSIFCVASGLLSFRFRPCWLHKVFGTQVFLYFLGPMHVFPFFSRIRVFVAGFSEGRWLVSQSTPQDPPLINSANSIG